jgi:hypothetical protein
MKDMESAPLSLEHSGSCVILPAGMEKEKALEILKSSKIFVLSVGKPTVCFPGTGGYVEVTPAQAHAVLSEVLDLCAPFQ